MQMELKYKVILTVDEEGFFNASVPALRGCHSFGATREEAYENIREAMELYLEALQSEGEAFPPEVDSRDIEVRLSA